VKKWLLPKEQASHFELELKVGSSRGTRQGFVLPGSPKRTEQVST